MRILSLYCGIGGHTSLIPRSCSVTAIDTSVYALSVYRELFPEDIAYCYDAISFLLEHHYAYSFIFATPPPRNAELKQLLCLLMESPSIPYCLQICSKDFYPKHTIQKILDYEFCCSFDISWRNPVVKPKPKVLGNATPEMIANMLPSEIGLHIFNCLLSYNAK
jgi:hypothetical protein